MYIEGQEKRSFLWLDSFLRWEDGNIFFKRLYIRNTIGWNTVVGLNLGHKARNAYTSKHENEAGLVWSAFGSDTETSEKSENVSRVS